MKLLLLLLLVSTSAFSQIEKVSRVMSISQYNSNTKTYVDKMEREIDNYITWKDGRLTIVCQDCKTSKFVYTVSSMVKDRDRLGDGYTISTYNGYRVSDGDEVTLMITYKDGMFNRVAVLQRSVLIIYSSLEDY